MRRPTLLLCCVLAILATWTGLFLRPGEPSRSVASPMREQQAGTRANQPGLPRQAPAENQKQEAELGGALEKLLHDGLLISAREGRSFRTGNDPNEKVRIEFYRTRFRFPLIRVEKAADGSILAAMIADHLMVRRAPDLDHEEFIARLAASGVEVRHRLYGDSGYLVTAAGAEPPLALETIAERLVPVGPEITTDLIEPDFIATLSAVPSDRRFHELYGMDNPRDCDIDAPEAWDISTDASNVVVGVIDSGISLSHPDLAGNIWRNPGEVPGNGLDDDGNGLIDDVNGFDFVNNDSDPSDDHGHGTHCAGTIGASGNNRIGICGVAWSAKLMALKSFDSSGFGMSSAIIEAIVYSSDMGARITSNSYGDTEHSVAEDEAIESAGQAGCLFVTAAGNDGIKIVPHGSQGHHRYVASSNLEHVLTVAATDDQDKLAHFSNHGSEVVHVGAPGSIILSTVPGGGYGFMSGTSMATPHVAGACALLLGQRPDLSPRELKDRVTSSADRLASLEGKVSSGGRLNLHRLIAAAHEQAPEITSEDAVVAVFNSPFSHQLHWTGSPRTFDAIGMPTGLSLERDTGLIHGVPVESGVFQITLVATGDAGTGKQSLALSVVVDPPLLTGPSTATGKVNIEFMHQLATTGEVSEFTADPLPPGLEFDALAGTISGHPLVAGEYQVRISASNPLATATGILTIQIAPAEPPRFLFLPDLSAEIGKSWTYSLDADGLPIRFSASGLPAGINFDAATGRFSGTPSTLGTHTIQVGAESTAGTRVGTFLLTVNPAGAPVLTFPKALTIQSEWSSMFVVTATNSPTSFQASGLPPGINLTSGGFVGGLPAQPGVWWSLLSATNASGTGKSPVKWTVLPKPSVVESPLLATITEHAPFIYQISVSGSDPAITVEGLPKGLRFEARTRRIVGTVLQKGSYPITIHTSNPGGTRRAILMLTVLPRPPVITSNRDIDAVAGSLFSYGIKATHAPESYAAENLPAGLSIHSTSGRITGTISAPGVYPFRIHATNTGGTGSAECTLTVHQNQTRIDSFSPAVLAPGDELSIRGTGFTGATEVHFSDYGRKIVPSGDFTVVDDTEIKVRIPYLLQGYHFLRGETYSQICVIAPRGLAVTFPPDTKQIDGNSDPSPPPRKLFLVKDGGALFSDQQGNRIALERGSSALFNASNNNLIFAAGGSHLTSSGHSPSTIIFHSPGATLDILSEEGKRPELREVSAIQATILDTELKVKQVPQFSGPSYAFGEVGELFSHQILAENPLSGDDITFGISGTLPPGVAFSSSTGFFSGSPFAAGVYSLQISASNPEGTAYFPIRITITGDPKPVITSEGHAKGGAGTSFSFQISAANQPTHFTAEGLPPGLQCESASGLIHGIPLSNGIFHVTLTATNAHGSDKGDLILSFGTSPLAVDSFSPWFSPANSSIQVEGRGLSTVEKVIFLDSSYQPKEDLGVTHISDSRMSVTIPDLERERGGWRYSGSPLIVLGSHDATVTFPPDAVRHDSSGIVTGGQRAPLVIGAGAVVTVQAITSFIYVEAGGTAIMGELTNPVVFLEGGATVDGTNSQPEQIFYSPGATLLNIDAGPTCHPIHPLSLSTLSEGYLLSTFTLPVITSGDAKGEVGIPFLYPVKVEHTNTIRQYSAVGLPPGLSIHQSSGVILGTPSQPGSHMVLVTATDPDRGSASKSIVIDISDSILPKTSGSLRVDGITGVPVNHQIGLVNGPATVSANGLPPGLALSPEGRLTGTPLQGGCWTATLTLSNHFGQSQAKLVVAIDRPIPLISSLPESTYPGKVVTISGTGFSHLLETRFKDRSANQGLIGTILGKSSNEVTVRTPEIGNSRFDTIIISLVAEGGTSVAIPPFAKQVAAGEVEGNSLHQLLHVQAGGALVDAGSLEVVYADPGAMILTNDTGQTVIFAEDGAMVEVRQGFRGVIVAEPGTHILGNLTTATLIRVPGLRANLVPGYTLFKPVPVITSASETQATLNVAFNFPIKTTPAATSFRASNLPAGLSINAATGVILGTPVIPGRRVAQVTATNENGDFTAELSITVAGEDNPFTGDNADMDGDSIPNLLEYAAKLNANVRDPANAVANGILHNNDFHFRYRRLRGNGSGTTEAGYVIEGVRYLVQTSSDANEWRTGPGYCTQVGIPEDNGDGSETVTVRIHGATRGFARLKVERVPH